MLPTDRSHAEFLLAVCDQVISVEFGYDVLGQEVARDDLVVFHR